MSGRAWRIVVFLAAMAPYTLLPAKPMLHDAPIAILRNTAVQTGPIIGLFTCDFWGYPLRADYSSGSYRPLVSLTYAVEARLTGNSPAVFHLTDMLLHGAAAVLFLLFLEALPAAGRWRLPAALLFALHPLQTEAVASVVGRADILAGLGLLGALVLHLRAPSHARPALMETGAVAAIAAAMLCKEAAVAWPFALVAVDLALRLAGRERRPLREELGPWLASFAVLGGYLLLRHSLIGSLGGVAMLGGSDNPLLGRPIAERLGTAAWLFVVAARLLVAPYALNHHYCSGSIPIVRALRDSHALAGIALLTGLATVSAYLAARRKEPAPAVAVALFVLPLAPALNTVSLTGVMFAERWMYVPVAGFALVAGWACERIAREKLLPLVSAAVLTLAGLLGAARIQDWNSMERLARSSIRGYPNGAKVWNELGISLGERGLHEEAAEAFKRSVALEDDDPRAWKNYATALFNLGRYQESAASWRRVLALSRKDVGVLWKGLGQAELAAGERAAAAEHLEKARTLLPNDGEIAADLSRLSGTAGEETLRAKYEAAVRLEMQGLHVEAARLFEEILTVRPDHAPTLFNLGRAYLLAGDTAKAIAALEKGLGIREDPAARKLLNEARRRGSSAPHP